MIGLEILLGHRTPPALALLLLAAAAPVPADCPPDGKSGQVWPIPLDLMGRPGVPAGLTGQALATPPGADATVDCRGPLQSSARSKTLRNESGDALHGLPAPEIPGPMDAPERTPQFQ